MILSDLHNHTSLCNHANGTVDEYVQMAISKGISIFGFSDHAPMNFDTKYRMTFEQMQEYEDMLKDVATKYRDKIDVRLGYEVDYIDGLVDERVMNRDVDYFIGSVHFIDKWGFDNPEFIGKYDEMDIDELWKKYFDSISKMAQTKQFDIVGHFDLIKVFKYFPKVDITTLASNALDAIADSNMVIELNGAGLRKPVKEAYPSFTLLKEIQRRGIPISFGSDAHETSQVGQFSEQLITFAKEAGFKSHMSFSNRKQEMLKF